MPSARLSLAPTFHLLHVIPRACIPVSSPEPTEARGAACTRPGQPVILHLELSLSTTLAGTGIRRRAIAWAVHTPRSGRRTSVVRASRAAAWRQPGQPCAGALVRKPGADAARLCAEPTSRGSSSSPGRRQPAADGSISGFGSSCARECVCGCRGRIASREA